MSDENPIFYASPQSAERDLAQFWDLAPRMRSPDAEIRAAASAAAIQLAGETPLRPLPDAIVRAFAARGVQLNVSRRP